jgi:hypothetical protein
LKYHHIVFFFSYFWQSNVIGIDLL